MECGPQPETLFVRLAIVTAAYEHCTHSSQRCFLELGCGSSARKGQMQSFYCFCSHYAHVCAERSGCERGASERAVDSDLSDFILIVLNAA